MLVTSDSLTLGLHSRVVIRSFTCYLGEVVLTEVEHYSIITNADFHCRNRIYTQWYMWMQRGRASILAFGLAEYQKEMQAIEECTHEIMVRSDQHAYDKDASDDESDDEAPAS